MTIEDVLLVENEVKRLMGRIKAVKSAFNENKYLFSGSKETAALKRSSMDLSRALTRLRKPRDYRE